MWLDMILIGFLVAFLRGGRLKEIPKFNRILFLGISVAFQLISVFLHSGFGNIIISISYLITMIFFYFNRELEEIRVLMIGWLLNSVTIWVNLGRMPVDLEQARKTPFNINQLINGADWKHEIITAQTKLSFLSDVIFVRYPIPRVISVGDIFIALGMFLLIQRLMNKPISLLKLREGKYNALKG